MGSLEKKQVSRMLFLRILGLILLIGLLIPSVKLQAGELKFKENKKTLLVGDVCTLKTTTGKKISWSSSKPGVANVNKSGKITAKKPGKAIITATSGGSTASCIINVKGTVDVIVFAGQSNMTGNGSTGSCPKLTQGAGFAYNYVTNPKSFEEFKEPFGRNQDDAFFQNTNYATGSMVSAFINSYYQQTKTPVIAISASSVGTGSVSWVNSRYEGVIQRTNAAVKLAKAQGLTVNHIYMVWLQGENDAFARMSEEEHKNNLTALYNKIQKKAKLNGCFLITIPSYFNGSLMWSATGPVDMGFDISAEYKKIQQAQLDLCKTNKNFYLVSTKASELNANYIKKDGIHVSQEGLNIIGRDAGMNAGRIARSMD